MDTAYGNFVWGVPINCFQAKFIGTEKSFFDQKMTKFSVPINFSLKTVYRYSPYKIPISGVHSGTLYYFCILQFEMNYTARNSPFFTICGINTSTCMP